MKQTLMRAGTRPKGFGVAGSVRTSISDVPEDKHGHGASGLTAGRGATRDPRIKSVWSVSDTIFERPFSNQVGTVISLEVTLPVPRLPTQKAVTGSIGVR